MSEDLSEDFQIVFGGQRWCLPRNAAVHRVGGNPTPDVAQNDVAQNDVAQNGDALGSMIHAALTEPVGFPPLDQAIVPGDKVVLAVDGSLPQLDRLILGITKWLIDRGLLAENLTIVLADASEVARLRLQNVFIAAKIGSAVVTHDADDQEHLAYLAAADSAEPIYMNRHLVEADVVIPVCCGRLDQSLDGLGCYSIYPVISDRATLGKFHALRRLQADDQRAKLRGMCDKAAWWLGVLATIEVIASPLGGVEAIYCGTAEEIGPQVQKAMRATWLAKSDEADFEVAVAAVGGDTTQQTWLNLARALFAVQPLVKPRGTIVVCSDVKTPLGKSLRRLSTVGAEPEQLAKKLSQDNADDTLLAEAILAALQDYEVFIVSNLSAEAIESLGVGSVRDETQLQTLIGQRSCALFQDAQFSTVSRAAI